MYVLIEACQDHVAGNNELISPAFMEGIKVIDKQLTAQIVQSHIGWSYIKAVK